MIPTTVAAGLIRAAAQASVAQQNAMRSLRDEIEQRDARIAELEAMVGLNITMPIALDLTAAEAMLLGMIYKTSGLVSVAAIEAALYAGRADADVPENGRKVIQVHVCRLRGKLAMCGITIGTQSGVGYFMTATNKARLRALIEAEQ